MGLLTGAGGLLYEDKKPMLVAVAPPPLVVRATVPGSGTWQWGATVMWSELDAF